MTYYRDGEYHSYLSLLPHLRNADAPTFFCDFDGVLNALPHDQVWIGGEDKQIDTWTMLDRSNWEIVVREPDPKKHFVWDNVVMAETGGRTFPLRFSSELMDNIKALIASGDINFVWLTSWNEDSQKVLNPILGLPADTPYLPWEQRRSDYEHFGKFTALKELLDEIEPDARQNFIWVDDVATRSFLYRDNRYHNFKKKHGLSPLVIQTDPLYGIDRKEWARIERFIAKQKTLREAVA